MAGLVTLTATIRDDDREIRKDDRTREEEPLRPPGDDDGGDDAPCSDPHRYEISPRAAGLLLAQPPLGARDREDVLGVLALGSARCHPVTVSLVGAPRPSCVRLLAMERTYGLIEVVGTSKVSIEDAVSSAVERTSKTTRHVDWFEVTQVRGYVRDGAVDHFQVSLKLGYRLEDA